MAGRKAPKKPAKKTTKRKSTTTKKPSSAKKKPAPKKLAPKKKVAAKRPAPKKKLAPQKKPAPEKKPAPTTPPASPSERLLATCGELPAERPLTDEERHAMEKVAETARRFLGAEGDAQAIVERIAAFVDDVRHGRSVEPNNQDVRLGLGVLWGEQLRAQVGWRWVHLTYRDGFASYALVPDDRAFACFPLNRVPEALRSGSNTSARVFESIRVGSLPTRKVNAYLVIG